MIICMYGCVFEKTILNSNMILIAIYTFQVSEFISKKLKSCILFFVQILENILDTKDILWLQTS